MSATLCSCVADLTDLGLVVRVPDPECPAHECQWPAVCSDDFTCRNCASE